MNKRSLDLQNFLFKYGIDTTTNFDLINIAKDLGLKIKVLMRDELNSSSLGQTPSRDELNSSSLGQSPSRDEMDGQNPSTKGRDNIKPNYIYIFNLESSKEEGSHWVSLYKNVYYFDPYGILPPKNITCEMYNTLQIQPDNTNMCGQLCLYILYHLDRGESFSDLILNTYEEIQDLYN